MSFQIVEILESGPNKILARVKHGNNEVSAIISDANIIIGKLFQAEISYDEVLSWKVINDFEDAKSGIWQEQDGIHLLGRVHNILDYGDGKTIIDVYMQNGPDFFTASLETMEEVLEANDGLEITVGTLYVYPTER